MSTVRLAGFLEFPKALQSTPMASWGPENQMFVLQGPENKKFSWQGAWVKPPSMLLSTSVALTEGLERSGRKPASVFLQE